MVATRFCLAAILLFAAACARNTASSTGGQEAMASRVAKNPNLISEEELRDPVIQSMDALKAIRYLRPSFFRGTGPTSFANNSAGTVQISHDYGPLQPVGQLQAINTLSLVQVRYLGINEAQNRFGINANGGPVIVLLSNKE
jgi:hypothetical protein